MVQQAPEESWYVQIFYAALEADSLLIVLIAPSLLSRRHADDDEDVENATRDHSTANDAEAQQLPPDHNDNAALSHDQTGNAVLNEQQHMQLTSRITFDASAEKDNHPRRDNALYIPGPRERDQG